MLWNSVMVIKTLATALYSTACLGKQHIWYQSCAILSPITRESEGIMFSPCVFVSAFSWFRKSKPFSGIFKSHVLHMMTSISLQIRKVDGKLCQMKPFWPLWHYHWRHSVTTSIALYFHVYENPAMRTSPCHAVSLRWHFWREQLYAVIDSPNLPQ